MGSGDMTTPNQGKIRSTFLQTIRSNKFFVILVAVVLATGIMAYNTNPVSSSNQFRSDDYAATLAGGKGGGGITSHIGGVGDINLSGIRWNIPNKANEPPLLTESPKKKQLCNYYASLNKEKINHCYDNFCLIYLFFLAVMVSEVYFLHLNLTVVLFLWMYGDQLL